MKSESLWPIEREYYELAGQQVVHLIEQLSKRRWRQNELPLWTITCRLKEDPSIKEKIERKKKVATDYSAWDLKDRMGVRCIVDELQSAIGLRDFFRSNKVFREVAVDYEEFVDKPRADGYRGIHMILEIPVTIRRRQKIPVELQIRTNLQHQWSELSHSEFYKRVNDIPPSLLMRMRILSEVLYCAEIESWELKRARVLDDCMNQISHLLRADVLERLGQQHDSATGQDVGRQAIRLLDFERQVRRALISDGTDKDMALDALLEIGKGLKRLKALRDGIMAIEKRVQLCIAAVPKEWRRGLRKKRTRHA